MRDEQMHSPLTNFQGSQENINEIRNSKRDLEEFIHPFSPVRRRRTPQPPPKVEVNIEGTDNKEISNIESKKEIPAVGVNGVTTNKPKRGNDKKKQKMDEYHTCMDDYAEDDEWTYRDVDSDENGTRTYERPTGQRKLSSCSNVNCSHSQSGCDASVSSQCSTNTFGGPRTMGKVHELYTDLQKVESEAPKKQQNVRDAQLKLNKWNWLLNWLDLSRDISGKTASRKLINSETVKKSVPKERKVKQQPQHQRQPVKQRNHIPPQQKEEDKGKIGRKSPSNFMKSKPKLAKNEGVDIVGLSERTKPDNRVERRTTIQKAQTYTKRRSAPRKSSAKKSTVRKKTQPKLTRKFLADIRKRYAKVIYKKK